MQSHANMLWDLSLSNLILGVTSSPDYYGCGVLPYTRSTRASVNLRVVRTTPGPSLVKLPVCGKRLEVNGPLVSCSL